MEVSICQLCKDPIWSFICPHCLARDIRKWLPSRLRGAFNRFNTSLMGSFSDTIDLDGLRCIRCDRIRLANICPFCYLAEVYRWLGERNAALAETIYRMLPMGHDWVLDRGSGFKYSDGLVPVTESELEQRDEGVCEACERYSEELVSFDGRWICRECQVSGR